MRGALCYTYEVYTHIRHLYSPHADLQLLNPVCYGPPKYNNTSSKLWPWIGAPVGLLMIYMAELDSWTYMVIPVATYGRKHVSLSNF